MRKIVRGIYTIKGMGLANFGTDDDHPERSAGHLGEIQSLKAKAGDSLNGREPVANIAVAAERKNECSIK